MLHNEGLKKMRRTRHPRALEERSPGLINLPIPSIPIVGPIVTPLVGGAPSANAPNSPPSTPASPAAPSPSSPPPSTPNTQPGGTSSGGQSGGGTNSGGGGNNTGSSAGSTPTPTTASPGSPGSNNNGNTSTGVTPTGAASNGPDSPQASATAGQHNGGTSVASSASTQLVNVGGANFEPATSSGNTLRTGAQTAGVSTVSPSAHISAGALGSGALSGGNTGGDTSSSSGTDPGSQSGSNGGSLSKHGLSTGGIAGIVVVLVLIAIALFIFLARKCAISKRKDRRMMWFRGGSSTARGAAVRDTDYFADHPPSSARSSFATTVDQGFGSEPWTVVPSMPPPVPQMTQSKGKNIPITAVTMPPVAATTGRPPSPTVRSEDGHPSRNSDLQAQYLEVPGRAAARNSPFSIDFPSPISVRPFSPTESWSFPKPPKDEAQRQSQSLLATVVTPDTSNKEEFRISDPASENPFGDFAAIETIQRPFIPALEDEMSVTVGMQVRVLKHFNDGWALGESVSDGRTGLFPIDCLRKADEQLPAFLASKRLSSRSGSTVQVGSAM